MTIGTRGTSRLITGAVSLAGLLAVCAPVQARPEYATKEKQNCLYCHQQPGGKRNYRGLYYATNGKSFANFDNAFEAKLAGVKEESNGAAAMPTNADYPRRAVSPALNFTVKDIDGKTVNLGRYQGSVVLVVNVASKCGLTPQYASLQKLYEKHKDKGLVILGFPANEFGKQEPGTNAEIKEFCSTNYKVGFPMFSKIVVKGEGQAPLYAYLTGKESNAKFAGDIEWNFAKFLIDRKGSVVARIPARTDPMAPEVLAQIEAELAKK